MFLPNERVLLTTFLSHLDAVSRASSVTLMNHSSLARTVGLRLLQDPDAESSPTDLIAEGESVKKRISIVEVIMRRWRYIMNEKKEKGFEEEEEEEDEESPPSPSPLPMDETKAEISIHRLDETTTETETSTIPTIPKIYADEPSMNVMDLDQTILEEVEVEVEVEVEAVADEEEGVPSPAPAPVATVDQRSIKITWKKNTSDEPLNEEVSETKNLGKKTRKKLEKKGY